MTDTIDLSNLEERNEQTLNDIKNLQQIEQDLYSNLEVNANNNTLTDSEKTTIINKINEISQMRINLYASLKDTYSFFQKNVSSSRVTLDEQIVALEIVENELAEAKLKMQLLNNEKYNKLRQVEINTYYGKKYNSHTDVMKIIVIMCIPLLILGLINNLKIIPEKFIIILIVIVLVIGIICIGYKIMDNSKRDNMNYDEYDWGFNEKDAPSDTNSDNIDPWSLPSLECIGPDCCVPGQSTYDFKKNKCIPNDVYNSNAYQLKNNNSLANYQSLPDTNSNGNDLSGMPISTNDVSGCQASCNSNNDCDGFVFNNSRECYLKNSAVLTAPNYPESGSNLYLKSNNTSNINTTTESFRTGGNNYLPKLNYSSIY